MTTRPENSGFTEIWQDIVDGWPLGKSVLMCPFCENYFIRILDTAATEKGNVILECRCRNDHEYIAIFRTHRFPTPAPDPASQLYVPQIKKNPPPA